LEVIEGMVALKVQAEAPNTHIWDHLVNLIKMLGQDGMSSDESKDEIHEIIEPMYQTRTMPWQRDIEDKLKIINNQWYLDQDIFACSGAKPLKRMCGPQNQVTT
jgi:hypothetical protein